ncbi:RHS repeat protein [Streptomyces sp. or43]|nr:RHS repeat protein [Streptomyces sp. or43]
MPMPRDLSAHRAVRRLPVGDLGEVLVDLHEGELIVRQLDLVVAGTGRHLRLVREYRSHSSVDLGFGPGWSLSAGPGFEPDAGGEPVTFTDARGRVVTLHRDSDGLVSKIVDPLGAEAAAFAYDRSGRLERHTGADGATTAFLWDAEGRLVGITDPLGDVVGIAYDGMFAVSEVSWTGPRGRALTAFDYGPDRTLVTGPTGLRTGYVFDTEGRPTAVEDAAGQVRRLTRDATGRPVSFTDATGATLTRTYDDRGRPASLRLPTGARSQVSYTSQGEGRTLTSLRDPLGNELLLEYDESGRLVRARAAGRAEDVETRSYDPVHGGLTERVDGNGARTRFGYDESGDLTTVDPPAPLGRTVFGYDGLSRITSVTSGAGARIGCRYDPAGRLTEVTDESAGRTLLVLTHDALGRVVRKAGPGWSYAFDWVRTARGARPAAAVRTGEAGSAPERVDAEYDSEGALTSFTTPGGTTRYALDGAGRTEAVTTPAGRTARFVRDAEGRPVRIELGAAAQEIRYDASGRRTALTVRGPQGEILLSAEYGYSSGGGADSDVLRSSVVDGEFTGFAYDGLKRLVRAGDTGFAYDEAHHLRRLGATEFTLNDAGQVVRFGDTAFGYDGAGNFTEETDPTGSFRYSAVNQTLTGVFGGVQVVDVRYDGLGQETPRRITETTVDGRTVVHVLTHSPLGIARTTDDGVPSDYVRTPDGALLAVLTDTGRHYWAVTDQQGSVLALIDEEGALAARYRYTAHGAVTASGDAAAANPFRYRGAYQLLRSAHLLDHHLYNGFWGRFTQPDPTGAQYAPYTFSDNDPVNSGTWTRHSFWSVLARPHLPAPEVFFPSPGAPDEAAAAAAEALTGPGAFLTAPPLIAWAPPSRDVRTLHREEPSDG